MAKSSTSKEKRGFVVSALHLFRGYLRGWAVMLVTTAAMILLATAIQGETHFVGALVYKTYVENFQSEPESKAAENSSSNVTTDAEFVKQTAKLTYKQILPDYLQVFPEEWNMKDFLYYWAVGVGSSLLFFQGVCGFFQWWYYVRQKDTAKEWKCQPNRWLSRPNEIHEIVTATVNMLFAGTFTALLVCWINNGNHNTLYHEFDKYGYAYFLASFLTCFLWTETVSMHFHWLMHIPFFYKLTHKMHHRYLAPTAYSIVAFTPLELLCFLILAYSPCLIFPVHTIPFFSTLLYFHYYTLLEHTGIMLEALYPWQPHTIFHDDHHKYFHCNLGFCSYFWDWFWGTWRDPNRIYGENISSRGLKKK